MGVIEKQGLQGSVLTYAGVVVGFVTAGILLPRLLNTEQIGVLDVINAWSMILATLATLGINSVSNRLFPYFRDKKNHHNGYLAIVFLVLLAGLILAISVFYAIKPYILRTAEEGGEILPRYIDLIIPLTVFISLYLVIDIYYAVLYKSVRGILHKEFLQRIYILVAILIFVLFVQEFPVMVYGYVAAICLPGVMMLGSLIKDNEFVIHINRPYFSKSLINNMVSVAFFGIVVAFSNIIIQKIDILMIENFMETSQVGVYSRTFFYGTLVAIPLRILAKISAVVTAQAWKDNQLDLIESIYKKSTSDQLIFGALVLIGLCGNLDNIVRIMGEEFAAGKTVVIFIGLSNLFLMAAGVSGAIISTSKYYKSLTLFVAAFGGLVIVTNLIFIPAFGIVGAAIASALSALFYGLMRFGLLWSKFNMQPYNWKHLVILLIAGASFGINLLIPDLYADYETLPRLILDIFVRSAVMSVSYILLIRISGFSPEINKLFKKILSKG